MTIAMTTLSKKGMVFACLRRNHNLRPVQIQSYVRAKYGINIASNVATMCRQDYYREVLHKTAPRLSGTTSTSSSSSAKKAPTKIASKKTITNKIRSSSTTSSPSPSNVISNLRQFVSAVKAVGGPTNAAQIIELLK